ncbi:MAG TPA: hypothetical protein DEG69_08800, partial [Flavobacteriaceae bacterium]|nr:hypothetical protein [Flavobacteriaceae bacterium]
DISISPTLNVFSVTSLDGLYIYSLSSNNFDWHETFIDYPGYKTAVSERLTFNSGFNDGVRIAVSDPFRNGLSGHAATYAFDSEFNTWVLEQEFIGQGAASTGLDLTWSDYEFILSSPKGGANTSGIVNIFSVTERQNPPRIFYTDTQQFVTPSDGVSGDEFGSWVESSEDGTLAISSFKNNGKGAVYIYEDISSIPGTTIYTENEQLQLLPLEQDGNFGRGISFDQNNLIIGTETISVYIYDTQSYELKNYINNNNFEENNIELGNFGVEGAKGDVLIWGLLPTLQSQVYIMDEAAPIPENERGALTNFYNDTNGENWVTNTNWLSSEPIREWFGISTNVYEGVEHISGMEFIDNNLNPDLSSAAFTSLNKLRSFAVLNTNGDIFEPGDGLPNTFSDLLPNLEVLNLRNWNIGGNLEPISGLDNLQLLRMAGTSNFGEISENISTFENLSFIDFSNNELHGNIDFLTNLDLNFLRIDKNNYQFVDFEGVFNILNDNIPTFIYSPQKTMDEEESISAEVGDDITLVIDDIPEGMASLINKSDYTLKSGGNVYQWYKDGAVITGATESIYTIMDSQVKDSGTYTCNITNPSVPDLVIIRAASILSVEDPLSVEGNFFKNLQIYPNPAHTEIFIQLPEFNNIQKIELYDLRGRLIKMLPKTDRIEIDNLEDGIYLLLFTGQKESIVRKFIKL